jgi:hypothetical protein
MITREKIKRLEREVKVLETIGKGRLHFAFCIEGKGLFYCNDKTYKATEELIKGEDIKANQTLVIVKKYA